MEIRPIASVKNVTKRIGKKTIIHHISFDIFPGEVFGFIGPNGAGKTTTIRMMVGLMSITEGDITIHDYSVQSQFEKAMQHVGAIVENPEMYPFMTGYQNLLHYSKMMQKITKERIHEVVELVGLEKRIDEKVKGYSLGMRQRLGLAQALLHSPTFLILDEPTNGLDPSGIKELRSYLRHIAKEENIGILVSSHLLSEMEMMCDRIGIIQNGEVLGVHHINEIINESDGVWLRFKVDPLHKAKECLERYDPQVEISVIDEYLELLINPDQIPDVIKYLVSEKINIYEVTNTSKSLEDKFLEVVGGAGIV